jgi:hypothetical protein
MNKPTQHELNALLTSVQVHSHMGAWARQQRQQSLFIKTLFEDGTFLIEEFEPAQKEVFYRVKWEDNEQYSVMVDVPNKYDYHKEASLGKTSIIKREIAFMKAHSLSFTSIEVAEGA